MKLIVNGKETDMSGNLNVSQLLAEQNVKMPDMVSVPLKVNQDGISIAVYVKISA